MAKYIDPQKVCQILEQNVDRIITLKFIKRTKDKVTGKVGEERTLTGRLGVKKYVKGVGMAYNPADKLLFTVYDMQLAATLPEEERAKAYRCVPVDSMLEIRYSGRVEKVEDAE